MDITQQLKNSYRYQRHEPIFWLVFLCTLLLLNTHVKAQPVVFSITGIDQHSEVFNTANELLAEVSKRSGLTFKLIPLPANRSNKLLLAGKIHGVLYRASNFDKTSGVIKLANTKLEVPLYAYSATIKSQLDSWQSLMPFSVLKVRGWIILQEKLPMRAPIVVDSVAQAFDMLQAHRADIFVADDYTAAAVLSNGSNYSRVRKLQPALGNVEYYTFMLDKYPNIAQRYNAVIKEMKNDGSLQRILKKLADKL